MSIGKLEMTLKSSKGGAIIHHCRKTYVDLNVIYRKWSSAQSARARTPEEEETHSMR